MNKRRTPVGERLRRLAGARGEPGEPNGARFGDAVAEKTAWTPARPGGSNFRTLRLVDLGGERLAFTKTLGSYAFALLFAIVGMGVGARGGLQHEWYSIVTGVAFFVVSLAMLWPSAIVFDLGAKKFSASGRQIAFRAVHAIQLIKERCGTDHPYWSYELNLVLADGKRINVVDHGDLEGLRDDAAQLVQALDCPLWDAAG